MASFLLATVQALPAAAGEVQQIRLDAGATGTQAEIRLEGQGSFSTLTLAGPDRLVVDMPASTTMRGLPMPVGTGVVKSVRTGQPVPGTLRIVFDLAVPVVALKPHVEKTANGARLLIEWPGDGPARLAATQPAAGPDSRPVAAAVAIAAPGSNSPAPGGPAAAAVDPQQAAMQATAALTASVVRQATTPSPLAILNGQPTAPPVDAVGTSADTRADSGGAVATTEIPSPARPLPPASSAAPPGGAPSLAVPIPPALAMRAGMRPLVVAIDPGHGGQDPGAIGPTGKREKDVTLAVARELARQINATPGLKAYLTRDTDVFIPLPMRARLARSAKADIFISIHADSAENRSATGSSVYVLSTKGASSQRARWLADKENAADLVGGVRLQQTENTLAAVLLDLAQSGHMKASEDAAGHVLGGLKRVGNSHKADIERANFAVLRTSDMPAMLVETAFISNPDEERRLISPEYQRQLASAVLAGVNTYFTRQPPPGTLYAARAQAGDGGSTGGAGGSP